MKKYLTLVLTSLIAVQGTFALADDLIPCTREDVLNQVQRGFSSFLGSKTDHLMIAAQPEYFDLKDKKIMAIMTSLEITLPGQTSAAQFAYNIYFDAYSCELLQGSAIPQINDSSKALSYVPAPCKNEELLNHTHQLIDELKQKGKAISDVLYPTYGDGTPYLAASSQFALFNHMKMDGKAQVLVVYYDAKSCKEVRHYVSEQEVYQP